MSSRAHDDSKRPECPPSALVNGRRKLMLNVDELSSHAARDSML